MKVPARILAPVALACVCAATLMGVLWWQLRQSTEILKGQQFVDTDVIAQVDTAVIEDTGGDASLIHLRQGDLLALRGEWADAEEEYQKSVRAGGGLPALRKLAQAQLQRRNIRGVENTLKKMKAEGARAEDVLLLESIIDLRSGELVAAREVLESAEDSPQKNYGLALLAIIQGNHQGATEHLQQVINGWDPVLRSYARTIYAAYEEYTLFPNSSDIHLTTLVARALAQVQECELALPLLVQVTDTQDDYRDAWIVQGYCELITERPEQALVSLEHAYSLDPQKPEIQYFLARAYTALGQYQNAITFLEYALQNGFQPESEIRRLIARDALEVGNAGLALEQYDALTTGDSATYEMYAGYVSAAIALGRSQEGITKAQQAINKWPEDARVYELLGAAALQMEQLDMAKQAYEKALELNPYSQTAQQQLEQLQ